MSDITRADLRAQGPYGSASPLRSVSDEEFDRLAREAGYRKVTRPIPICRQSGDRMWSGKCPHPEPNQPCEPMNAWLEAEDEN